MDPMDSTTYKEIFQQPQAFLAVNQDLKLIRQTVRDVFSRREIGQVIFTGCGTSLYLAQTAARSLLPLQFRQSPGRSLFRALFPSSALYRQR